MDIDLARRATAEAIGTCLLVAVVVGSGIAAARLAPDDPALVLLANSAATAAGLAALIAAFMAISGAHLNPAVTLAHRIVGRCTTRDACVYIPAQLLGGALGAVLANLMFDLAPVTIATQDRASSGIWLAEVVATFGLITVILAIVARGSASAIPYAVAGYIAAGYWFTSSTSFANPAVTIARSLTDTFTGIAPESVPGFLAAQLVGCLVAVALIRFLITEMRPVAQPTHVPHDSARKART